MEEAVIKEERIWSPADHERIDLEAVYPVVRECLNGFSPDYDIVDLLRTPHAHKWVCGTRKGDTFNSHVIILGYKGNALRPTLVCEAIWSRYGMDQDRYVNSLRDRTRY